MIIDDYKLLQAISDENVDLSDLDELDLNNQKILDELAKIDGIYIYFGHGDEFDNTLKQLCKIIDKCPSLKKLTIHSMNKNTKDFSINYLINLLINRNIKQVSINGFNLDYLELFSTIISSPNETIFHLDEINDPKYGFAYVFGEKKLRKKLTFNWHGSSELNKLYSQLRLGKISLSNYKQYKDYLVNYSDLYISIGNVNDLDLDELENLKNDNHIKGIYLECGYDKNDEAKYYTMQEYESIRNVVTRIVKMVKMPKEDDPNREKIIFAQVYKILSKNIRYDHYAISDEGTKDSELSNNCRNLKNGLLGIKRGNKKEYLSICAGYATILQNICACFNIKCDYISSHSKEIITPGLFSFGGPRHYENGTTDPMGHAYNAVCLDGKSYLCDLTWDADQIKIDNLGKNFLKSYEEFFKSHKNEGFSSDNVIVIDQNGEKKYSLDPLIFAYSCSYEEQLELFGIVAQKDIEEMTSEGYLADFAIKNIEYIKQVKGRIGMLEYLDVIKMVHQIEKFIKSPDFKTRASFAALAAPSVIINEKGQPITQKDIIFYPGLRDLSTEDAIKSVEEMEERQWKIR